eukprot:6617529-Heterocapsa_arctica.AAC.1
MGKAVGERQRGTCKCQMEARGAQRGSSQGETPQKCEQYTSIPSSHSKRSNSDRRNREKQHNYVTELPSFKGANPPSNEGHGSATNAGD